MGLRRLDAIYAVPLPVCGYAVHAALRVLGEVRRVREWMVNRGQTNLAAHDSTVSRRGTPTPISGSKFLVFF